MPLLKERKIIFIEIKEDNKCFKQIKIKGKLLKEIKNEDNNHRILFNKTGGSYLGDKLKVINQLAEQFVQKHGGYLISRYYTIKFNFRNVSEITPGYSIIIKENSPNINESNKHIHAEFLVQLDELYIKNFFTGQPYCQPDKINLLKKIINLIELDIGKGNFKQEFVTDEKYSYNKPLSLSNCNIF